MHKPSQLTWRDAWERMVHATASLLLGTALLFMLQACERQGPPPKPIGAATNKHVEDAPPGAARPDADAMIQQMKTPMERARQTEDVLKESADRAGQLSDRTAP